MDTNKRPGYDYHHRGSNPAKHGGRVCSFARPEKLSWLSTQDLKKHCGLIMPTLPCRQLRPYQRNVSSEALDIPWSRSKHMPYIRDSR